MQYQDFNPRPAHRPGRRALFLFLFLVCAWITACSDGDPIRPDSDTSATGSIAKGKNSPNEYVSILSQGVVPEEYAKDYGLTLVSFFPGSRLAVFEGSTNIKNHDRNAESLTFEASASVAMADPIDLLMGYQEGFWDDQLFLNQDGLDPIELPTVLAYAKGSGVRVAILDTGADFSHPHLVGHLLDLPVPGLPLPLEGGFFGTSNKPIPLSDSWGHGTHVAGIVATCAPLAQIWPIKVFDDRGVGTSVTIAIGLAAVLEHGADIVNLSLRLSRESPTITELLRQLYEAGVEVFAAAGNEAGDPVYPASSPYTFAVTATGINDFVSSFSSTGLAVHLAAPGEGIVSSYPDPNQPQKIASGTSMACAVASGTLACVMGQHDRPITGEAIDRIINTADPVYPDPKLVTAGRVSPTRALMVLPIFAP